MSVRRVLIAVFAAVLGGMEVQLAAQVPDHELCETPLHQIFLQSVTGDKDNCVVEVSPTYSYTYGTSEHYFGTVESDEDRTIGEVQLYLSWEKHPFRRTFLTITSPAETTVVIGPCDLIDRFSRYVVSDTDVTLCDHGASFAETPANCRCLLAPPGENDIGLEEFEPGRLSDFEGESTLGVWTLDLAITYGGDSPGPFVDRWCLKLFDEIPPLPVEDLECRRDLTGELELSWDNAEDYDSVAVYRDSELLGTVAGPLTKGTRSTFAPDLATPQYARLRVLPCVDTRGDGHPSYCYVAAVAAPVVAECAFPRAEFDEDTLATSTIGVDADVAVRDLQVDLTGIGNYRLVNYTLTSPAGTSVALYEDHCPDSGPCAIGVDMWSQLESEPSGEVVIGPSGLPESLTTIMTTFWELGEPLGPPILPGTFQRPAGTPSLRAFFGESSLGDWVLTAEFFTPPTLGPDIIIGTLEDWCLRIYDETPATAPEDVTWAPGSKDGLIEICWTNTQDYDEVRILLGDEIVETIAGPHSSGAVAATVVDIGPYPSAGRVCVQGVLGDAPGAPACHRVRTSAFANLECTSVDGSGAIDVSWERFMLFEEIVVRRDGLVEATLPGDSDTYTLRDVPLSTTVEIEVEAFTPSASATLACRRSVLELPTLEACDAPEILSVDSKLGRLEIDVSDAFALKKVEIAVDVAQVFVDFSLWVVSPDGTHVHLHQQESRPNLRLDLVFSDDGPPHYVPPLTVEDGCRCLMQPHGPGDLSDFAGASSEGTWTLVVEAERYFLWYLHDWCVRLYEDADCSEIVAPELSCSVAGEKATVTWRRGTDFDQIEILRDRARIALVDAMAGEFADRLPAPGTFEYRLVARIGTCATLSSICRVEAGVDEQCVRDARLDADPSLLTYEILELGTVDTVELALDLTPESEAGFEDYDLTLSLESPLGTTVRLLDAVRVPPRPIRGILTDYGANFDAVHLGSGSRVRPPGVQIENYLDRFYLGNGPALAAFAGEEVAGIWQLTGQFSNSLGVGLAGDICLRLARSWCDDSGPSVFRCTLTDNDLELSWTNGSTYDRVEVHSNGDVVAVVDAGATSWSIADLPSGHYEFAVEGIHETPTCRISSPSCGVDVGLTRFCDVTQPIIRGRETVPLDVTGTTLAAAEVSIDLAAGISSDWLIRVRSPSGTEVILHDHRGSSARITAIFSADGAPFAPELGLESGRADTDFGCGCRLAPWGPGSMQDFVGESPAGDWELELESLAEEGFLNEWCLLLYEGCSLAAPTELACDASDQDVALTWSNNAAYDRIDVFRDGLVVTSVAGATTDYVSVGTSRGRHEYRVRSWTDAEDCGSLSDACVAEVQVVRACSQNAIATDDELLHMDELTVFQDFDYAAVQVEVHGEVGEGHELWLQSPWGTEVALSWDGNAQLPIGERIDVVFAADGLPYRVSRLGAGERMLPVGPGTLSDLVGEPSTGFQPWRLRFANFTSLEGWCVAVTPTADVELLPGFRRGDASGDQVVSALLDALYLLQYQFLEGSAPPCLDAADVNDDGLVYGLTDALALLQWGFLGAPDPPAPGPYGCGLDSTPDALTCEAAVQCY